MHVRHSSVTLMEMVHELEEHFLWRAVAADDVVLAAGQRKVGIQVLLKGSCWVRDHASDLDLVDLDQRLHACEEGAIFGLGALLYAGKVGCEVVAGPEGAELLHLDEKRLLEYLEEEPSVVNLLKAVLQAQVESYASDFWTCC